MVGDHRRRDPDPRQDQTPGRVLYHHQKVITSLWLLEPAHRHSWAFMIGLFGYSVVSNFMNECGYEAEGRAFYLLLNSPLTRRCKTIIEVRINSFFKRMTTMSHMCFLRRSPTRSSLPLATLSTIFSRLAWKIWPYWIRQAFFCCWFFFYLWLFVWSSWRFTFEPQT